MRGCGAGVEETSGSRAERGIFSGARSQSSCPSSTFRGRSVTVPTVSRSMPFRIAPVRFPGGEHHLVVEERGRAGDALHPEHLLPRAAPVVEPVLAVGEHHPVRVVAEDLVLEVGLEPAHHREHDGERPDPDGNAADRDERHEERRRHAATPEQLAAAVGAALARVAHERPAERDEQAGHEPGHDDPEKRRDRAQAEPQVAARYEQLVRDGGVEPPGARHEVGERRAGEDRRCGEDPPAEQAEHDDERPLRLERREGVRGAEPGRRRDQRDEGGPQERRGRDLVEGEPARHERGGRPESARERGRGDRGEPGREARAEREPVAEERRGERRDRDRAEHADRDEHERRRREHGRRGVTGACAGRRGARCGRGRRRDRGRRLGLPLAHRVLL